MGENAFFCTLTHIDEQCSILHGQTVQSSHHSSCSSLATSCDLEATSSLRLLGDSAPFSWGNNTSCCCCCCCCSNMDLSFNLKMLSPKSLLFFPWLPFSSAIWSSASSKTSFGVNGGGASHGVAAAEAAVGPLAAATAAAAAYCLKWLLYNSLNCSAKLALLSAPSKGGSGEGLFDDDDDEGAGVEVDGGRLLLPLFIAIGTVPSLKTEDNQFSSVDTWIYYKWVWLHLVSCLIVSPVLPEDDRSDDLSDVFLRPISQQDPLRPAPSLGPQLWRREN